MAPKSQSSSQGTQIFFSVEAGVGYSPTASKKPGGSSSKKTAEREEQSGNSHERKKPQGQLQFERKRFKGGRVNAVTAVRRRRTEYAEKSEESGGSKDEEKAPPPEEQEVARQEGEMRGKDSEGETCVHCKTGADVKDHEEPAPTPTAEEKKTAAATEDHTPSSKDQAGTAPSPAAEPSNLPKGDDIVVSRKLNGKTSSEELKAWPAALTTATLTSPLPTPSWESVGHHAGRPQAAGRTDYPSAFRTWARRNSSEAPEVVESEKFIHHFDPAEQSPAADLTGGKKNKGWEQNGFINHPKLSLQGRVAVPDGRHVPTIPHVGFEKQIPLYEGDFADTKSSRQPLAHSSYPSAQDEDTAWVTAFHDEHPPPRPPKILEDMCIGSAYRGDPAGPSIEPRPGSAPPRASPISRPTMIESSARRRSAYQDPSPPPGPSHYDPQLPNHRHTNSHEHTRYTDSRDLQGLADGIYGTRHGHPRPKTDSATRASYLWDMPNHRHPKHPRSRSESIERESEREKSERYFQGYANPGDRASDRARYADRSKSRWQPKCGEKEPAGRAYEEKRGRSTRTAKPAQVGWSILDEDDVEAWMDETLAVAEKEAGFVGVMKEIGWILEWLSDEKDQGSELSEKQRGILKKLLEKVQRFQEDKPKRRWSRDLK